MTQDTSADVGSAPEVRGGTSWRRTAVLLVPALIAAGVLVVATVHGPLPLNLVVSGQDLKLTSNGGVVKLPRGMTLYPSTIRMKNGGETRGVMIAGLPEAVLTKGLCISLVVSFPAVGAYTVALHTSGETTAKQMTLDASGLEAGVTDLVPRTTDGKAGNGKTGAESNLLIPVTIGEDASALSGGAGNTAGLFGIDAPGNGSLTALRASAQGAIIAGTVKLAGLSVRVHRGSGVSSGECY